MNNYRKYIKKTMSILLIFALMIPYLANITVSAEETPKFPYMMFGRNGITMDVTSNLCINGNVHTNKEAVITASNKNINGQVTTGADIEKRFKHVYANTKIRETYFTENCELYEDGYTRSEMNIHINNPIYSYRNIQLDGNVSLNSNIGTLMNINVTGEVKNANTSVVYSKYGDITIENDSTANINGLIYCPLGTLTINSPNVSINGVIIADKIVINGGSVNINTNEKIAGFIGTETEDYDFTDLIYLPEDWLGDTDKDELFDIYEKVIDTDPFIPDTDGDKLPDGYEVLTLATDPLEIDTDENGISDADEDFDHDNLNNLGEYQYKTEPFTPDTDEDGLLDGDEIKTYGTDPLNSDTDNDKLLDGEEGYDGSIYKKYGKYFDPLNPDTNGNGVLDGDEVFGQSKKQAVKTHDKAITEVKVDMNTNGSLERNLEIESMYGIDAMSSEVYAMIGEPFNFTSETSFESATITFKVDKSKLGNSKFDKLIILWYNEKKQTFEEMPTTRNASKSTLSTTTKHFSQYMVVDSEKWYDNWENSFYELRKMWTSETSHQKDMNTIFLTDCSSSMGEVDSISYSIEVGYNGVTEENHQSIISDMDSPADVEFNLKKYGKRNCTRTTVCENIIGKMGGGDRAAVMMFSNGVDYNTGMSVSHSYLINGVQKVNNDGGSSHLNAAVQKALSYVSDSVEDTYRIIVITHSNISYSDDLSSYDYTNVKLNIVNLGPGSISSKLENIVHQTGGEVYNAVNASDLTYQVGDMVYTPPEFIGQDSDGDTIPDFVELYGLKPNGQPINTNPNKKDTDDDGLDDNVELKYLGEQLTSTMTKEQYDIAVYCGSDPTKPDTDGDGLLDGKRQYYNNKVLLPKDPSPTKYDGPKGVWQSQKEMVESGNIPTSYTSNPTGTNTAMNAVSKDADELVDFLLEHKGLVNKDVVSSIAKYLKQAAENTTEEGADFLDFIYDNQNMAYHSQVDTWQRAFGYNNIYDKVFDYSSEMLRNKMEFSCNGNDYILWSWKGDYWNLQSGAETGLYVYDRTINGEDHYDVVDFELPMTLSLFNCTNGDVENVFSWAPNEKQWWVTGFNPEYTEPNPNIMVTISSVDFTGYEGMYNDLKSDLKRNLYDNIIFDDDYKTIWVVWD